MLHTQIKVKSIIYLVKQVFNRLTFKVKDSICHTLTFVTIGIESRKKASLTTAVNVSYAQLRFRVCLGS